MHATPFYAALLGLFYIFLSVQVIRHRRQLKVSLGSKDNQVLHKAIRAHANFSEYVPLSLILLWFLESIAYQSNLTYILGSFLLAGRLSHCYGIQANDAMQFRVWGMVLTFIVIAVASIRLLWHAMPMSLSL